MMNLGSKTEPKEKAINDPIDLDAAHRNITLDNFGDEPPHLEVTQQLMDRLTRQKGVLSITYGTPGVRLFVEGKKNEILDEESMRFEDHRNLVIKRTSEAAQAEKKARK